MSEHIDIFNILYAIKDKISDNDFLELNNKIQKLIQENKDLRKEKDYGKIIHIMPIQNSEIIQYRYSSDEYYEQEVEDEDFLDADIPQIV